MTKSVKLSSAIIPLTAILRAGILWTAILSATLLWPSTVQAQSCVQLCDEDFWRAATAAQIQTAIAKEGVTARTASGSTPLHFAAGYGTPENVTALLEAGANIEAQNKDGSTPFLHYASRFGPPETVRALLAAGANIKARTEDARRRSIWPKNDKIKGTDAYRQLNEAQFPD